jgi:hypothetical protein
MKKLLMIFICFLTVYNNANTQIFHRSRKIDTTVNRFMPADSVESVIQADSIQHIEKIIQTDSLIHLPIDTLNFIADTTQYIPEHKDTISLVLVGDVMLGTNYPSAEYLPPGNNCSVLLDSVRPYLQDADITFCNLEGVFAGDEGTPKSCKNPENCYVFRMPDPYVHCIIDAGFDLVSVANNHVNDFGYMGRYHAAKIMQDAKLNFAGFAEYPYTIIRIDSLKIGFCAFAPHSGVVDMRDITLAENIVKTLADSCDIVLVSVHAGGEGKDFQHVTRQDEKFLDADRGNIYDFAHRMIDAGADVIIGHGPHVTRAMEIYNNRFIAYSLGNFCTYARFNLSGPNGIAPLIRIRINSKGRIIQGDIVPVMQTGEGGPKIDPERKVIFKLQELLHADFPDEKLSISNDGKLIFDSSGDENPEYHDLKTGKVKLIETDTISGPQ